jgi:hypothetical protein
MGIEIEKPPTPPGVVELKNEALKLEELPEEVPSKPSSKR